MNKPLTVHIIGCGIAGIATAIRLQVKGMKVTVFEKNSYPGGKLSEIRLNGYRFDAGPSLFTLPHLVDELFTLAGKDPADYFSYEPLPVITRYFYPDGTVLNASSDPAEFASEVNRVMGEDENKIHTWLAKSQLLYDITSHVFLERSLHKASTYLRLDTLKSALQLHKLDAFRTMHTANAGQFSDDRVVQLFDRYATYNGSNPYEAPATLNIIPHLEHNIGAYFPKKGMYDITLSLYKLAEELGVEFMLNTPVEKIVVEDGRARGTRVAGSFIPADIVVSNADIVPTYRKLLPDVKAPERTLQQPRSSSALIFYWGMKQQFSQLDLHNIFFSDDYQGEFQAIWQEKTIFQDPTVYVYISSKRNPEDAPEGGENWFVMINVPPNSGQDWDKLLEESRANILQKLEKMLGMALHDQIVCEEILDPRAIDMKTSSWQGALYGNSSNNRFAAFLRHPNFHPRIKGLYFCGGSVHPGGGIPLCLLSASIVDGLITEKMS